VDSQASFEHVRYLLTFCSFARLPEAVRAHYLVGQLHLLPFPGSLAFWGMPTYLRLQKDLPLAMQIPMLRLVQRHSGPYGVRIPQSGWLHEPRLGREITVVQPELLSHHYRRSHRWERIPRFEQELTAQARVERVVKVLFSTDLQVMGLYDKPMARNCQLWDAAFHLLLATASISLPCASAGTRCIGTAWLWLTRPHPAPRSSCCLRRRWAISPLVLRMAMRPLSR
jgi:hypothetical protein